MSDAPRTRALILRMTAALLGGYAFTWGLIALLFAALFAAGLPFHDAEGLASLTGLLAFTLVFLWAFAARSIGRVWLVLAGGAILMTAGASLMQRALLT